MPPPKDLSYLDAVSQIDWARLAAYIDGEGCISIGSVKRGANGRRIMYVQITIANTDPRLGQWLISIFGGAAHVNRSNQGNPKWSPAVAWNVGSRHAARLLEGCLPYFVIKREQADVALAFQATILTDRRYGVKGRPQSIIDTQDTLRTQLQTLKGTSSRAKRSAPTMTLQ